MMLHTSLIFGNPLLAQSGSGWGYDMFKLFGIVVVVGLGSLFVLWLVYAALFGYRKVQQGSAIIRTGRGGSMVSFDGISVTPLMHRMEVMDISVKRVEISRHGASGLICKDNIRADIKVAFFVRVNNTQEDVLKVAGMIGVERASDHQALMHLFEAKFSEALKTAGKAFDFEDLYTKRLEFKEQIKQLIGTDLNGYHLEDAAIDELEQTPKNLHNPDNVLDVQGLDKITRITQERKITINEKEREQEKAITRQNVDAREKILDMERELANAEATQRKEIDSLRARTEAETHKVQQEERLRAEQARINTDEQLAIAEENKKRQIIVAEKSKEKTEAVETERVEKDRALEATERERVVTLAQIERDKQVEIERKTIQEVIRERVAVERTVAEQEEKIKDTRVFAELDRRKADATKTAEAAGDAILITESRKAEASKKSAELNAERDYTVGVRQAEGDKKRAELYSEKALVEAETAKKASALHAEGMKSKAEGDAAMQAAPGIADARAKSALAEAFEKQGKAEASVQLAMAESALKQGTAEADVYRLKAQAEAQGRLANAEATQKQGAAEADVSRLKYEAETKFIHDKAEAMKKLDGVGRDHEEFKLRLAKEQAVELAQITVQADIAAAQSEVLKAGLASAKIDIVGGDTIFFDKLMSSVIKAREIDSLVGRSKTLTQVKDTFFDGQGNGDFKANLRGFVDKFGVSAEELKSLSTTRLLNKLAGQAQGGDKDLINQAIAAVQSLGLGDSKAGDLLK